jgi:hypothetical protein
MKTRRLPPWGNSEPDSTDAGGRPGQVAAETERLVRLRADGKCEACQAALDDGDKGVCSSVYTLGTSEVFRGPANTVLLCAPCWLLADDLDPQLEARGIWVGLGPGPCLTPMIVPRDDGSWMPVWRSADGRYLFDPPAALP